MAEVIGLIGSIWTLVSIAGAATRISRSLLRAANTAGSAREEIETFALDIQAFASVVRVAHYSLRQHCSREPDSPVLMFLEAQEVLEQLVAQSRRVIKNIQEVRPKIRSIGSSIDWVSRFRWLWRKSEVQELGPKMDSVISRLHLVMTIVSLETATRSEQSPETHREIQDLKRQIKVQMQTIKILQERQVRQERSYFRDQYEDPSHTLESRFAQNVHALLELGEAMVKDESQSQATSSSIHTGSINVRESSSSYEDVRSVSRSSPSDSTIDEPNERLPSESPMEGSSQLQPFLAVNNSKTAQNTRHVPEFKELSQRGDSESSRSASVLPHESDYVAVRPAGNSLVLDPNPHEQVVNGCINGIPVDVNIVDFLPENVVSLEFAHNHDLDLMPLEKDAEPITLDFGGGIQETSIGSVVLVWSKGVSSNRRPFRVSCLVCEFHLPRPMFGQPFLERRRHYWGS